MHLFPSLRHMAIAPLALAFMIGAAIPPALAQMMSVPGKLEVTQQGAASYTIPLAVPPGTAGMAPTLTLSYNSQQGDGPLGVGWSLTGLSSITRCPQTMAQDGVRGTVNYDANDRFCLDGQRLMAFSGSYGADGSEYRTEIEGFAKVISHGTAGNGPAWFEVRTKTGQIMEFGHTADSLVLAQGKATARLWQVNKIADTKGNYLTVTYTTDAANGQAYPSRVDYTGNAATRLTPYNSVRFVYEARPDVTPLYHAGSMVQTTVRLKAVQTLAGASLVNEYRLVYQQDGTTGISELASVTQCGGSGSCLPGTSLTWLPASANIIQRTTTATNNYSFSLWVGDLDGNGKADFMSRYGINFINFFSNGDGTFREVIHSPPNNNYWSISYMWSGDFNGDGKMDILSYYGGYFSVFRGKGDGSYDQIVSKIANDASWSVNYMWTVDLNGDGKTDALSFYNGNFTAFIANGDGTFTQSVNPAPASGWSASYMWFGDFNGDGKMDFASYAGSNKISVFLSNGDGTFSQSLYSPTNNSAWQLNYIWAGDINGDGKTDLISYYNGNFSTFMSKGDGTFNQVVTAAPDTSYWSPSYFWAGDFDGDGKTDFLSYNGNAFSTFLSKGNGEYKQVVQPGFVNNYWNPPAVWIGDLTGTGKAGLLSFYGWNISVFSTGDPGLRVSSIRTGLGTTTNLSYKPLTDSSVYTKGSGAVYPVVDVQAPIYVVSQLDAPDGIGGRYKTNYTYSGAKADSSGRGLLGFASMTVTDPQTNVVETTSYNQTYPLTGLPSVRTKSLNGSTLNQDTTTYTATALGGTRYFVAPSQVVSASTDLSGTAMPTITTTTQYDGFGNPTQVKVATPDGASRTTTNTYTNDTANWLLGRLTRASVTSVVP